MERERWARINELFDQAEPLGPEERERFLASACGDDAELRREVLSLLESAEETNTPLVGAAYEQFTGAELPEDDASAEGAELGTWRVLERVGAGGMATVHRGERADDAYEQEVAIKFLRPGFDTGTLLRRFLNERQTLASLEHPNIARLLDGGTTAEGRPYLVLEFIRGVPLLQYCQSRALGLRERLAVFEKICSAVAFAHRNLVVHRDLKPANILVTEEGEPKLLDFGIAKILDPKRIPGHEALTVAPLSAMTPEYASPEQVRGEAITTASDVYSLGVILYELLTGAPPYEIPTRSIYDIERIVCEREPGKPSASFSASGGAPGVRPSALEGDLDAITLMALRKEPERRYGSVDALAEDLERYRRGLPVSARPDSVGYRLRKYLQRHRVGVAASTLVLLSLVAAMIGIAWQGRIAADNAARATRKAKTTGRVSEFLVTLFDASDPWDAQQAGETPIRVIVDRGARSLRSKLAEEPQVRTELQVTLGRVRLGFGQDNEAEAELRAAVVAARVLEEEGAEEILAAALNWHGVVLWRLGRYDEAADVLEECIETYEGLDIPDPEGLAGAWNALGLVHLRRGLHTERARATSLLEKLGTLNGQTHAPGPFDASRRAIEKGLKLRRAVDEDLEEVPMSISNLGAAWRAEGQAADWFGDSRRAAQLYSEARSHFEEAVDAYARIVGERSAWVATVRNNLGMLLRDMAYVVESDQEAVALFHEAGEQIERSISIGNDFLGADHPHVATWWNNLGLVQFELDDARAVDSIGRAIAIAAERLEPDHPTLATFRENLDYVRGDEPE